MLTKLAIPNSILFKQMRYQITMSNTFEQNKKPFALVFIKKNGEIAYKAHCINYVKTRYTASGSRRKNKAVPHLRKKGLMQLINLDTGRPFTIYYFSIVLFNGMRVKYQ